ncbi:hypothetical protein BR93DRAFT_977359 [Coniochaeta sp. PMI_546]|nr:hypothetical protein BR93DRAFT_977359 [Coniochaeta sp. PMI_546]
MPPPTSKCDCTTPEITTNTRWYKFWLGWTLVRGFAEPVETIVDHDPIFGPERQIWRHVLRLHVHSGVVATAIRWQLKPDWEGDFDNEIKMYSRLKPLQDVVVPVFYGEIKVDGTRALLLSDVGGKPLVAVNYAKYSRGDLERMVQTALRAIYSMGVSPCDANLVNCHVVGDRIMIVDHEQDEELEEEYKDQLDELVEAKAESIMDRHWEVHKPKKATNHAAERRAAEEYRLRNMHLLSGLGTR